MPRILQSPRRRNHTRYDEFWNSINWQLPDTVLAEIWHVDRANLRARRIRLGIRSSKWRVVKHYRSPVFCTAVEVERVNANKFDGQRPAGPARGGSSIARLIAP